MNNMIWFTYINGTRKFADSAILFYECSLQLLRRNTSFTFKLVFVKLRSLSRFIYSILMGILTTIREVNYRCSHKRWFYREHPGSKRTPLRLHKSQKVDIAARCNMPLRAAAAIRLSRIASALSRICNIFRTNNYLSHVKEYRAKGSSRCCLKSRQSFIYDIVLSILLI